MKKLLSNKWGKILLVAALSLLFMILSISITTSVVKEGGTQDVMIGSLFLYISLPALYFVTVLLNYLRFKLTKMIRFIVFVATMAFFVIGTIFIFMGAIADGHVVNDKSGYAFVYGMAAGSMVTWTLLFFDFRKLGYNQENAEKRSWQLNLIFWGACYLVPFILAGFLFLIIHGIKSGFIVIVLLIAFLVLTAGAIYKSIRDYGSPLGSKEEWHDTK